MGFVTPRGSRWAWWWARHPSRHSAWTRGTDPCSPCSFVCQPELQRHPPSPGAADARHLAGILTGARVSEAPELQPAARDRGACRLLFFSPRCSTTAPLSASGHPLRAGMAFNLLDGIGLPSWDPACSIPCSAACSPTPWWPGSGPTGNTSGCRPLSPTPCPPMRSTSRRYSPACIANRMNPWTTGWPASVPTSPTASWPWPGRACWWSRGKRRRFLDLCFTLTWRNHALLSYISALGAHRDKLEAHRGAGGDQPPHQPDPGAGRRPPGGEMPIPLAGACPAIAPESSEGS